MDAMGRVTGSWLSGPQAAMPEGHTDGRGYRGEELGLPESGPGSLAESWRRAFALFVDWVGSGLIAIALTGFLSDAFATANWAVWFGVGVVSLSLFGFTPGQLAVGIRVVREDGVRVGPLAALVRQLFVSLVVPALLTDRDGRGMQDRVTRTVVVLSR